jgi:hypothetical protein
MDLMLYRFRRRLMPLPVRARVNYFDPFRRLRPLGAK